MSGIQDYSTTPGSNTSINGIDIAEGCAPSGINNAIRQMMADVRAGLANKGSDIASASSIDLGAATGDFVDVTGTTGITAMGTVAAGVRRTVRFTGALTLTHNATSLILPGGANITTAAGDIAGFRSLGSGNWVCEFYSRASGAAIAGLAASDIGVTVQGYDADTMISDTTKRITANMGFTPVTDTSSSGAVTFDFATGNIAKLTLTENITSITLSGAAAGDVLEIWITQAAGGYTVTGWPAAVKWSGGGTAYTASTTSGAVDIIMLRYDGTNYYGSYQTDHQ